MMLASYDHSNWGSDQCSGSNGKYEVCMQQPKTIDGFGLRTHGTLPANDRPNKHLDRRDAVFRNHFIAMDLWLAY